MLFLGCDPGLTGGVALIEYGKLMYVGRFAKDSPLTHAHQLRSDFALTPDTVSPWLEEVEGWPGEDVKSIFSFGREYGRALCMFEELKLEPKLIDPQFWQKGIGWHPSLMGLKPRWAQKTKKERYESKKARKDWIWHEMERIYSVKLFKDVADAVAIAHYASLRWGL